MSSKRFCVTWNNYTDDYREVLTKLFQDGTVTYIIAAREIAPSTGTKHLQIYLETPEKIRPAAVSKFIKGHISIANGTAEDSHRYIILGIDKDGKSKGDLDEEPIIWGQPLADNRKKRSLEDVVAEKKTSSEIAETDPVLYVRHFKGLQALDNERRNAQKRGDQFRVILHYGESGTGKSYDAMALGSSVDENYWQASFKSNQLPDYNGQRSVLMDEWNGGRMPRDELLGFLDRGTRSIRVLYGEKKLLTELIVITSNQAPWEWYKDGDRQKHTALWRRFEKIIHYGWAPDPVDPTKRVVKKTEMHCAPQGQLLMEDLPNYWKIENRIPYLNNGKEDIIVID